MSETRVVQASFVIVCRTVAQCARARCGSQDIQVLPSEPSVSVVLLWEFA